MVDVNDMWVSVWALTATDVRVWVLRVDDVRVWMLRVDDVRVTVVDLGTAVVVVWLLVGERVREVLVSDRDVTLAVELGATKHSCPRV
jgi:hypothetical protein